AALLHPREARLNHREVDPPDAMSESDHAGTGSSAANTSHGAMPLEPAQVPEAGGSPSLGRTPRPPGATEVHAWLVTRTAMTPIPIEDAAARVRGAPVPGELVLVELLRPREGEAVLMREQMKLHHLAVEDVMRGRQRPKLERYPRHYFVVFYAA